MRGSHDLGGMQGLGAIAPEPEIFEPVFHAEWEKRMFALTLACGFLGQWNLDESRHARERQTPEQYLKNSYYENWLVGLKTLLVEKGLVSAHELSGGHMEKTAEALGLSAIPAEAISEVLAKGGPVSVSVAQAPRFQPGDLVHVRNDIPTGHTRAPAYIQGKVGRIEIHHGAHVFPDENARRNRVGEHLYNVSLPADEIWSDRGDSRPFRVRLDLWEPYLESA